MRIAVFVGGALGVLLLVGLAVHTDLPAMLGTLQSGGWRLAWLLPYRSLFFGLYGLGWLVLLHSASPTHCVRFGYVFWVCSVREAVDRLLPVASVGGSFVGVRLMRWLGFDSAEVGATIIAEIVLTMIVSYIFAALVLVLLASVNAAQHQSHGVLVTLLVFLPVPLVAIGLLRYGSVFERLERIVRQLSGLTISAEGAVRLDHQVRSLLRDHASMSLAGTLELFAIVSGSFEIWFTMRLFGRPVTTSEAVILESMTVALRHVAFIVPAGIGVQELGLMVFGRTLGIDNEFALAMSVVKRARELIWGIPGLISWQWLEGRRLARCGRT